MAEINILEKEVFNRIAAGEVVGSPASIVKELAENAIDAGATEIDVEIQDGGIRSVTVADNGIGIPNSEVRKAFLPHATSKIKSAEDMETIGTLGFRGEALPSIASVSKVVLRTKFQEEKSATLIRINGGIEEEFNVCALEKGTIVEVSGLFYNTPARFKFLKSVRSEESSVTSVLQGLILANPEVAFQYKIDGELKFKTDGLGLPSAVKSVYPSHFDQLLPVRFAEDSYKITGFTSKSGVSKGNRSSQTVVLNGRIVTDPAISATVQNAYGERLMTRSFPIFVFDIVMPFDLVDVNVHPSKAEVRLRDARRLYGMIYRAVKDALDKSDREIENSFLFASEKNDNAAAQIVSNAKFSLLESIRSEELSKPTENVFLSHSGTKSEDFESKQPIKKSISESYKEICAALEQKDEVTVTLQNSTPISEISKNSPQVRVSQEAQEEFYFLKETNTNITNKPIRWNVVGQIFKCYLIVENGEKGFIIDQHAAHERTIYDKLMKNAESESPESQPLLLPYIFRGSAEDCEFILKNRHSLSKIGFDLDEFGKNSIKVSMVPCAFTGINLDTFFQDLLSDASGIRNLKTSELLHGKLATLACKSAIKSGDELSPKQIDYFIEVYMRSGAPILCPHGRPTILPFDKLDLEKRFKRKL